MASDLITPSDRLVTQLGLQTDKNSNDLVLLQTLFAILIVAILKLILYLARMFEPIFDLTQATAKWLQVYFLNFRKNEGMECDLRAIGICSVC